MSYFALVPAAGGGARMAAGQPKQYLPLAGRPLIQHVLETFAAISMIERVYVVLAPDDVHWETYDWTDLGGRVVVLRCGGTTRAASVANGLRAMQPHVAAQDWVLVHDAARVCLTSAHVVRLIDAIGDDPVGGLLAVPVADTLKEAGDDGRVTRTVARERLWQAQTPQMFRHGLLVAALDSTPVVTDEAGAIEAHGKQPKLVTADATNFKVTWPADLHLAELILHDRKCRT